MDDKKVDELMTSYTNSLGSYSGRREPAHHRFAWWKPLTITGAGVGVVTLVTLMMVPRRAIASSEDKVLAAFQRATYWHVEMKSKDPKSKKWISNSETTYCDGRLKSVSGFPASKRLTTVLIGRDEFDDFKELPYILKTPIDSGFKIGDYENPMDHALRFFRTTKNFKRKEAEFYRGIEAYEMVSEAPNRSRTTTVTISKATNLPLVVHNIARGKVNYEFEEEYDYDRPASAQALAPDPGKPIVDVKAERTAAIERFAKTDLDQSKPIPFESVLGKNGELWMIFGVKDYSKPCWIPLQTQPGYRLGTMFMMSSYGRSADFFVKSHEIVAYLFIPTTKAISRPKFFDFEFIHRPMFSGGKPNDGSTKVHMDVKESKWTFPEFMPSLALQVPVDFIEDRFFSVRGHTFMAQKKYRDAAECFVKEFESSVQYGRFVKTDMSNPMEAAAKCYDLLGDHAKAKECRRQLKEALIPKLY